MKYIPLLHGTPIHWDDARKKYKGGGGQSYYEEANRLYGLQADTADFMLGLGKENLPGAVDRYREAALQYQDPVYAARMAGQANTDAQRAIATNNAAMGREMARYGLNPASGRYGNMLNQSAIQGAQIQADAANKARNFVEDKKFGAAKDFYSSMVGMSSDSANAVGNSASGFAQMGNQKAQQSANNAAGWGQAVGTGVGVYSAFMRDGGRVEPRMASGGLMGGRGLMGGASQAQLPPAAQGGPSQGQSAAMGALNGFSTVKTAANAGKGLQAGLNSLEGAAGDALVSAGAMPETAVALQNLSMGAAADGTLPAAAGAAGSTGTAAGTAAAGEAAAGTAAAGEAAAGTALSSIGAAVPYVGAALAIGAMFGLFDADGGEVGGGDRETMRARASIYQAVFNEPYEGTPEQDMKMRQFVEMNLGGMGPESQGGLHHQDMRTGGGVAGPGTETSDSIPAMLSKGEYVLNSEAVKQVGKSKLDKINKRGLKRRYGA